VVERLLKLIRLRNSHPAFQGTFAMAPTPDEVLELEWSNAGEFATAHRPALR
jgi:sucrose phosphorylase